MRIKLLGHSGLKVSELCLGTMTFGNDWGWGADRETSKKMFDLFAKAGGNFIDTANVYTNGTSEKFLGDFLQKDRDSFVLATKYTSSTDPADPNAGGNHRKSLHVNLEQSLKRLKTDYVDLLWVHAWDQLTPIAEVMRALDDVVRAGKVLYIGSSDAPAWYVARANTWARDRGLTPFAAIQVQYNIIDRTPERELLPMADALDIAVTAWSPLAGGFLSGKFLAKKKPEGSRLSSGPWAERYDNDRARAVAAAVVKVAKDQNRTPSQVAIAWLRSRPTRVLIPILGARTVDQLKDNMAALDFSLPEESVQALDQASAFDLGFPLDFLNSERILGVVHGNSWDKVDNHRR